MINSRADLNLNQMHKENFLHDYIDWKNNKIVLLIVFKLKHEPGGDNYCPRLNGTGAEPLRLPGFSCTKRWIIKQINWCDYIKLGIWSTTPINNKIMSIDYCGNNKRTQSAVSYAAGVFY